MDRLIKLFAEVLEVERTSLSDQTSPENTDKWDSLKSMNLVAAIEEEFSIELTTKEIMSMRSIGMVRAVLERNGVKIS